MGSPGLVMYSVRSLKNQVFFTFPLSATKPIAVVLMVLRLFLPFQTLHLCSSQEWEGAKDESYTSWACWLLSAWWCNKLLGFPGAAVAKNPPAAAGDQETEVPSLGREAPLEQEMAARSRVLAWRIPRTEELGGCSPRGHRDVTMTEPLSVCTHAHGPAHMHTDTHAHRITF